ncbi:hypothetical protein C1N87_33315 (plasmid) [Priestia aryabhattai]
MKRKLKSVIKALELIETSQLQDQQLMEDSQNKNALQDIKRIQKELKELRQENIKSFFEAVIATDLMSSNDFKKTRRTTIQSW